MPFIAIEGLDGSGKSSQIRLLREYLDVEGISCHFISFPRDGASWHGQMVSRFLRGEFGQVDEIDPYFVALLFAGDRKSARIEMERALEAEELLLTDRYVLSNLAFQCAKAPSKQDRDALRQWILDLEFGINRLPRPDVSLYLDVPFEFVAQNLSDLRHGTDRDYLVGAQDIHEDSLDLQENVAVEYEHLLSRFDTMIRIDCHGSRGEPLPLQEVNQRILGTLREKRLIT